METSTLIHTTASELHGASSQTMPSRTRAKRSARPYDLLALNGEHMGSLGLTMLCTCDSHVKRFPSAH